MILLLGLLLCVPLSARAAVRLTSSPWLEQAGAGSELPAVDFQEMTTTHSVPFGQWREIAGLLAAGGEPNRRILGWQTGPDVERRTIRLKVERLP